MKDDHLVRTDFQCDYPNCNQLPIVECYPIRAGKWWYFCLWHFIQERAWRRFGYTPAEWLIRIPLLGGINSWVWNNILVKVKIGKPDPNMKYIPLK